MAPFSDQSSCITDIRFCVIMYCWHPIRVISHFVVFFYMHVCTFTQTCTDVQCGNKQPHHVNPPAVSPLGSVVTIPEMFVNYGDNVTLECKAGGGPGNVYQWEHDGVTIAGGSTSYLIVSSLVDPADLGTYTCVVSNAAGIGKASSVVHGKTPHAE